MVDVTELRQRARRWRQAADTTRNECLALARLAELHWRSPAADGFRQLVQVRLREMRSLAEREDALADLLDRVADSAERAA